MPDKVDQLYDALKADGAVSKSRENFRSYMLAPGKEGYNNRLQLYKALNADGAVQSKTYEEFRDKLGIGAVNPQRKQQASAAIGGNSMTNWANPVDVSTARMSAWERERQPKTTAEAPVSAHTGNGKPQNVKTQVQQQADDLNKAMAGDKEAAKRSGLATAVQRMKEEKEYYDATGKPLRNIVPNPLTAPTAVRDENGNMLMGQTTDEQRVAQYRQVERDDARKALDKALKEADKGLESRTLMALDESKKEQEENPLMFALSHMGQQSSDVYQQGQERMMNQGISPEALWEAVNRDGYLEKILNDDELVSRGAAAEGMDKDEYIQKVLAPQIADHYDKYLSEKFDIKGFGDYAMQRALGSVTGTILSGAVTTKKQREMRSAAIERANEGLGSYKPGVLGRLGGEVAMFVPDATILAMTGVFGEKAATAVGGGISWLGNKLKQEGLVTLGQVASSGSPFLAANVGRITKWTGLTLNRAASGTGLGAFMGTSAAIQDLSVGDGSLASVGKAFLSGFGEGTATGALLGVTNLGAQTAAGNIAGNTVKAKLGRAGMFGTAFVAENQLFANMDRFREDDFDWVDSSADAFYMQLAGKVSSRHSLAESMKGVERLFTGKAYTEKAKTGLSWQSDGFRLDDNERSEIERAFGGTKLEDVAVNPDNVGKILNDKEAISWKTRQKVAGSMGMLEPSRPRTDRILVMDKMIDERAEDNELIETHTFNTDEEKQAIIQRINEKRDNNDMLADYDILRTMKVQEPTEAEIHVIAERMLENNPSLRPEDVQEGGKSYDIVVDQARDEFNTAKRVIMDFAHEYGMYSEEVEDIMKKDPVERTDEEYELMNELASRLHAEAHPKGEFHPSQSRIDGRKLAGDDGAVTPEAAENVAQEMRDADEAYYNYLNSHEKMREAVEEMGNARPDEIYMHIYNDYSGTERDEFLPILANRINAQAKQEGFVTKVGENIEDTVQQEIDRYSFKGKVDDSEDTENIITFTHNGKEYTMLNGQIGTRREPGVVDPATGVTTDGAQKVDPDNSGDMIIALDENNNWVFLKPDANMQLRYESKADFSARRSEELGVQNTQNLVEAGVVRPEEETTSSLQEGDMERWPEVKKWLDENPDAKVAQLQREFGIGFNRANRYLEEWRKGASEEVQGGTNADVEAGGENTGADEASATAPIEGEETLNNVTGDNNEPENPVSLQPKVATSEENGIPLSKNGKTKLYHRVDPDVAIDDILQQPTSKFVKGNNDPNAVADRRIKSAEERLSGLDKKLKKRFEEQNFTDEEAEDLVSYENGGTPRTEMGKYVASRTEIEGEIDYYKKLKGVWQQRKIAEAEEARRKANEAALKSKEEQPKTDEAEQRDEMFKANREKFEQSKEDGDEDTIVLANGETIEGRYVLVDADAVTPSHNPRGNFAKSEGFPVDENGKTINDRDYENDKNAQVLVQKRSQSYDQRAVNTPVVVSEDGIVLSGNDRTMSGQMAADNGTDGAYVDYITKHAKKWGFTSEQVSAKKNPRIVFVPNEKMPYNAETFAKFNQDEKKSQSKLESSVKLGKVLATKPQTLGRIGSIIDQVENLGDLYSDAELTKQVLLAMREGGLITDEGIARLTDENGLLSAQGKDEFETMLAGVVVDEDALRILNNPANNLGDLRKSIAYAVVPLVKNQTLGDYSIVKDVSEAVRLYDSARKAGLVGKDGDITNYFINKDAFDGAPMDAHSLAQLMIANQMSKGGFHMKRIIEAYNSDAQGAASGQVDMWTGGIRSKEDILTDILKSKGYDAETIKERVERLRATEPPVERDSEGGERGEDTAESRTGEGDAEPERGGEPERGVEVKAEEETEAKPQPTEKEGGKETVEEQKKDEYLEPRNDKEKEIISDVEKKLAEEIKEAEDEVKKARSALEKAQSKESDKATDIFSDDEAFKEKDQLFDFEDMPTDRSKEGVEKRTQSEREQLLDAQEKLNKLQSEAERNSRIRGALDEERRQTKIPSGEPEGTEVETVPQPERQHFIENVDKAPKGIKWSEKTTDKEYTYKHVQLGVDGNDLYIRQTGTYANNPSGKEIIYKVKDYKSHSINDVLLDIIDQTDAAVPRHVEDALQYFYRDNGINPNSILRPAFTDPTDAIEKAATEFKKEQDKQIGITREETPEQKAQAEGEEMLNEEPLTEEDINNSNLSAVQKTWAKAYLNGKTDNELYLEAYLEAKEDVRNRRQDNETDRSDAGSGTQLAGTDDNGERRPDGTGSQTGGVDAGADVSTEGGKRPESGGVSGVEDRKDDVPGTDGKRGDNSLSGQEPELDGLPPRGKQADGGSLPGSGGHDVRQSGSDRHSGGLAEQPGTRDIKTRRTELKNKRDELLAKLKSLKEQEKKDKSGELKMAVLPPLPSGVSSYIPKNKEQRAVFWELATTTAEYGYTYLEEGITKFNEWKDKVYRDFVEPIKDFFGWGNNEVDHYIEQVWNSDYEINGVTRTMAEWASLLEPKKLREVVGNDLKSKFEQQKAAESVEVKTGDIDNIRKSLPYLLPEQQDDVLKAETQFFDESHQDRTHGNGKGIMFTNGTGTGKTYTGLGIVKRFVKQGKGRVLIITPSQEKVTDWANDGLNLGLQIEKLDDVAKTTGTTATKSKGKGVVVTTYANARQNLALLEDCFDLIVYDESHKITEGKEAAEGEMYKFHQMLTNKNVERSMDRQTYWLPEWIEHRNLLKEREVNRERLEELEGIDTEEAIEERHRINARMTEIANRFEELRPIMQEIRESKRPQAEIDSKVTKTVFLSATPFNRRENLKYAEGYLFSYPEEDKETIGTYNHRSPEDAFLEQMFPAGYRWRYGRLEQHVSNAEALGRQEIDFSDYLQNQLGTMSGRMISSDYDYSRDFPVLTLDNAGRFNQAMSEVYRNRKYQPLAEIMRKVWNYNDATSLFEAMKTSLVNDRIKEHLARGQKVVVFHRRRTSREIAYPFERAMDTAREVAAMEQDKNTKEKLLQAVKDFESDFRDIFAWEKTIDYTLPREQIEKRFGKDNVAFFSGAETKNAKHKSVEEFMKDNGGKDIIVIQEASGKEGISLHDQTGEHQRVEINLALPQSPIAFIQIEGRIYRIGQKSNAIFEYPLLGLDLETNLFAQQFNNALGTTENLALGSKARNLRKSIANSVLENTGEVDYDRQGLGGKDMDGRVAGSNGKDGFDVSIQDYYGNQKMKKGRDNREGVDYFPTPEPVGYKMVEWAQMLDGETALEPSAGHGAIARYVPETNGMTAIEPSASLFTKLQMRAGGPGRRFEEMTFEDYPLANKHDVILMNPPYGVGGKTAMEHVAKAFRHLNEGGRIVAIIPDGPSMEKRLNDWLNSKSFGSTSGIDGAAVVTGEVKLPSIAFGRAGTSVMTRIVVIDKVTRAEMRKNVPEKVTVDLSNEDTIGGLFDRIRNVRMPERTIDQVAINTKKAMRTKSAIEENPFARGFNIMGNLLMISNRSRYDLSNININLENPNVDYIISRYRELKKVMDDPSKLDYGRWENMTFGRGKNATPAVDAIKDYCEKVIKTLENVSGMTADQMDKAVKQQEEARLQREREEQERQERERQERIEKGRVALDNLRNEFKDDGELPYLENLMTKAHTGGWSSFDAKEQLRKKGVDWETGKKIITPKTVLRESYNDKMPLDLDTMERLMDIAETSIDGRRKDAAKRALEMSGIHSDTGKEKENFDYASHDEYYEKDLREFLNTAGGAFTKLMTKQQKAENDEMYKKLEAEAKAKNETRRSASGFEYKLDKNTRTGEDMHLVTMNNRLSDEEYKAVERKAKALNGYYNRFKKAWHFKTEEDARKFMENVNASNGNDGSPTTRFRLREKEAPKKTQKVYKLMRLGDDGKLYPLFIDAAAPTELGKWYDADSPDMSILQKMPAGTFLVDYANGTYRSLEEVAKERNQKVGKNPNAAMINEATENGQRWVRITDTGRGQRRYGGETRKYMNLGINGSGQVGEFAMRPGWHAGSLPSMRQIGKGSNRNLRDDRFVWVEGEVPADKEWQSVADKNPDKDIPTQIPEDGFYMKATNANKSASQADRIGWYVAGAFKANRIMSDVEARNVITRWNEEHPDQKVEYDWERESGKDFNAETMQLEDRPTTRFRFAKDKEDFDKMRDEAVKEKGLVVRGLADTDVKVTKVPKHDFSGTGRQAINSAKEWAKKNLIGEHKGTDSSGDEFTYHIDNEAIGKFLSQSSTGNSDNLGVHLAVLKELPTVIGNSIEAEVHPDYLKDEVEGRSSNSVIGEDELVHRFYGAAEIDGKVYRVKTTILEKRGDDRSKPHDYKVTKVDVILNGGSSTSDAPRTSTIVGAKLLKDVEKSYDSGKKLLDESEKSTYFRKNGEPQNPVEEDFERKRKAGEKVAKSLNMDFEAVTDKSQIKNREVLDAIAAGEEPTGWIEIDKDGKKKIYMYLPNIRDTYEAEKTIAHETIGHYGLRELLGEKGYKDYMRSLLFDLKDEGLKKYWIENVSKNGFDTYRTIDEYLAEAAEKGYGDLSMWQKVKEKFTDALRKRGFLMSPSISDVKYMVWLSKHNLEKGNTMNDIRRNALLHRLERERYEAKVSNGEYSYDEAPRESIAPYFPGEGKTLFRHTPSVKNQRRNYERSLHRVGYVWKESHIDAMQSAVELVKAMTGVKKIEDIPSAENFILLENQMSSKEEQMDFLFNRDYMKPLDEAVAQCLPDMGGDVDRQLRNLQLYMIKKHGLERNRVLFVRDKIRELRNDSSADQNQVNAMEQDYLDMVKSLRDDLSHNVITLREYFEETDRWIRKNLDPSYKAGDKDYSGLTDIYGKGYNESDIIDDVMSTEDMLGEERVGNLWEKTKAVSQFGLDMEYEGGLDSKEKHDKVSEMFEWYVPLRGYNEKTAEEAYDYLEEHDNTRKWAGPVLMNAKGRESLSDVDVFATLGSMNSYAINRALRNQMKQAFARFVRNHYKDVAASDRLVTELPNVWMEKQYDPAGNEIWVEKFPDIPENAKADDIANILDQYQQDMKAKQATGDAKRIRQRSNIPYRNTNSENKAQHIVDVWINGEKHAFVVNGNPRAAQAINGQLKAERNSNILWMSSLSHFMAKMNTSYSPDFIVRNTERDLIFSAANLAVKENARYWFKWAKNYAVATGRAAFGVPAMHTNLFKRYRKGELNMSNETDRYFKEFMENGGETGWVERKNLDKWKEEIKKGVQKKKVTAEEIGDAMLLNLRPVIEAMNERAENLARFATYMTSRQSGRSIVRSVSDAKEVSVNFNRKGAGSKTVGIYKGGANNALPDWLNSANAYMAGWTAQNFQDYIMFYNAGVQGLNNMLKSVRNNPIKGSTAFALFAMAAMLMPRLNKHLFEEDDDKTGNEPENPYAELPEYVRRNNLCIYMNKGSFATIALPIELRAMYGIGDMAAGYLTNPELRSTKNMGEDIVTQLSQVMPINFMEGGEFSLWNLAPSGAVPFLEAGRNKNWLGQPIERDETQWNENKPRWTRAFKNVGDVYVGASKKLNAATNPYGDENIKGWADGAITDPALVEHVINGYFGGVGSTVNRVAQLAKNAKDMSAGEILSSNWTPIARTMHYTPNERTRFARTRNKWWHYKEEMDKTQEAIKALKNQGKRDPISFMKSVSEEEGKKGTRAMLMQAAYKSYNKIKKKFDNTDDLQEKNIYQLRMDKIMEEAVKELDKIK